MYLNHIHANTSLPLSPRYHQTFPFPLHVLSKGYVFILVLNMRKRGLTQPNYQASADVLSQ